MGAKKFALAELLAPSRLKIERAKHHINELDVEVKSFLARKPFRLMARVEKNPPRKVFFIKDDIPIPPAISLITGDAIHNLKSALDMLAWAMVGDQAINPKRVLFPFADTREGLVGSIANRQIHLAGEDVVTAIKELEPHGGGNELLYGIQVLDTTDKHHIIIPVGQIPEISGKFLGELLGIKIEGSGCILPIIPMGEPIVVSNYTGNRARLRSIRTSESEHHTQPPFRVCFAPDQPFSGFPIVEQLYLVVQQVEIAVTKIGEKFISSH